MTTETPPPVETQEQAMIVLDNTPLAAPREMDDILTARRAELDVLLADTDISPDRFIRTTVHALARQPDVLKASKQSILLAVLEAAKIGLEPTGALGGAHLVRFGTEAALIIDWRGYLKLLFRNGMIRSAWAEIVFEGDEFAYQLGTSPSITHIPTRDESKRGKVTHAYFMAELTSGGKFFEVMTKAEVEDVRKSSRAGQKGPWVDNWNEMARKSVVRRGVKYLPFALSGQLARAIEYEDDFERAGNDASGSTLPSGNTPRERIIEALSETSEDAGGNAEDDSPNGDTAMDDESGLPE